ncbi:hypothetical protein L6452_02054 [Arctium lappa]|uniref:Uncharacterized protein n=1 Tax=Arctium lappa TaxID=4217 RepID=A0ACB9FJM7_ARCLA|nr:hypothetical protein L6452_02054 [Arctium lappa]
MVLSRQLQAHTRKLFLQEGTHRRRRKRYEKEKLVWKIKPVEDEKNDEKKEEKKGKKHLRSRGSKRTKASKYISLEPVLQRSLASEYYNLDEYLGYGSMNQRLFTDQIGHRHFLEKVLMILML